MPHEVIGELIVSAIEVGAEVGSEIIANTNDKKSKSGCAWLFFIGLIVLGVAIYYFNNY